MNVIFSRKGMDSKYGKVVNPILPDGTMLSLPIPRDREKYSYFDSFYKLLDKSLKEIIEELTDKKFNFTKYKKGKDTLFPYEGKCHRDPDINKYYYENLEGWTPALGYTPGRRIKLNEIPIKPGDIFLFYGTFKPTYYDELKSKLKYIERYVPFHAIFGYLEVKELKFGKDEIMKICKDHPHAAEKYLKLDKNNFIYISHQDSSGVFRFSEKLLLSAPYRKKTVWHLPDIFLDKRLIFKPSPVEEPKKVGNKCEIITQSIGQEFIVEMSDEIYKSKFKSWIEDIKESIA